MMKTWYKLTPEETTRIYCVPTAIANQPNNHFWGLSYTSPEFLDGDWPLVVLSTNAELPSVATLQIFTAPMEVLHEPGSNGELENGNPLDWEIIGHYLRLPPVQLDGLCQMLKAQKDLFVDDKPVTKGQTVSRLYGKLFSRKQPIFRLLGADEIQRYRLHPEWFPGVSQSYYIQLVQPTLATAQNTISLVTLSTESQINDNLTLEIMAFEQSDLLDESFTPLNCSRAQLHLTWAGLLELTDLLSQAVQQAH